MEGRGAHPTTQTIQTKLDTLKEEFEDILDIDVSNMELEGLRVMAEQLRSKFKELNSSFVHLSLKHQANGCIQWANETVNDRKDLKSQYKIKATIIKTLREEKGDENITEYTPTTICSEKLEALGTMETTEKINKMLNKQTNSIHETSEIKSTQKQHTLNLEHSTLKKNTIPYVIRNANNEEVTKEVLENLIEQLNNVTFSPPEKTMHSTLLGENAGAKEKIRNITDKHLPTQKVGLELNELEKEKQDDEILRSDYDIHQYKPLADPIYRLRREPRGREGDQENRNINDNKHLDGNWFNNNNWEKTEWNSYHPTSYKERGIGFNNVNNNHIQEEYNRHGTNNKLKTPPNPFLKNGISGNIINGNTTAEILLKRELMQGDQSPFSGESSKFHAWAAKIERKITGINLSPMDVIDLLETSTKGEAKRIIQSYAEVAPASPEETLNDIWTELYQGFGTPVKIYQELSSKLEAFPFIKHHNDKEKIRDLIRLCRLIKLNMNAIPQLSHFNSDVGMQKFYKILPTRMFEQWRRMTFQKNERGQETNFKDFIEYLETHQREINTIATLGEQKKPNVIVLQSSAQRWEKEPPQTYGGKSAQKWEKEPPQTYGGKSAQRWEKETPRIKTGKYIQTHDNTKVQNNKNEKETKFKTNTKYTNPRRLPFCTLCSTTEKEINDHTTKSCSKYPDPKSKILRLKTLKGCEKCGYTNHQTTECKRIFRYPCVCGKDHFTFLCKERVPKRDEKQPEKVNTGTVFVGEIDIKEYGEDVILPTFSVKYNQEYTLRGMRDSGCQPNFIKEETAKKLNLKVIKEDLPLHINGFNTSKTETTQLVEIDLRNNQNPIKAICIPEVKLNIKLKGLSTIVNKFKEKGYKLADKFLGQEEGISNLDLILGSNDAQILPQKDVEFGRKTKSIYMETPLGICLCGGVNRILKNIEMLPNKHKGKKEDYNKQSKVRNKPKNGKRKGKKECKKGNTCTKPKEPQRHKQEEIKSKEDTDEDWEEAIGYNTMKNLSIFSMKVTINQEGRINEKILEQIVEDHSKEVNKECPIIYDDLKSIETSRESDDKLFKYVVDCTTRDEEGNLTMPLLWNHRMKHLLQSNTNLSKAVLLTNIDKLKKDPEKLKLYNETISKQIEAKTIEKIEDIDQYLEEHPTAAYIPHMGVYKMDRETTKCRIVLLSNLTQKNNNGQDSISHNKAMLSGPNLNSKITTAITKLRFDTYFVTFDIQKAFHCIKLYNTDQQKLLFHWFQNPEKNDFRIVTYKFKKLPFGLRCSPTLLMIALYIILIKTTQGKTEEEIEQQKLLFDLMYMDNGAYTSMKEEEMKNILEVLKRIFNPFHLYLQQMYTNLSPLQEELDKTLDQQTPEDVKLLGLQYNRKRDTLSVAKFGLNEEASTKRQIISSIASNFDILQICGPMLNRARLFAHKLQCAKELDWDEQLSDDKVQEWIKICRQLNNAPKIEIDRCMGNRKESYTLQCYTDASKQMTGCVLYLKNNTTGKISFLQAKNRMVGNTTEGKTIPKLELHAIMLGVEVITDIMSELTGENASIPIDIDKLYVFSDSAVALSWLDSYVNKLSKMQQCNTFVMNRLDKIVSMCEKHPIKFAFIAGLENPADQITRPTSYKQLMNSNYLKGLDMGGTSEIEDQIKGIFPVPNPNARIESKLPSLQELSCNKVITDEGTKRNQLVPLEKFSSMKKIIRVNGMVIEFINKLKSRVVLKNPQKFKHIQLESQEANFYDIGRKNIIRLEQRMQYPEIVKYLNLEEKNRKKSQTPKEMKQWNVFMDMEGILRVKTKFKKWISTQNHYPVLLHKNSTITNLIIREEHEETNHSGIYYVTNKLKYSYFIPHIFSNVKRIIKNCVTCKRFNARNIKLNQSDYRDFRSDPPQIPFRTIFIDHFGPYQIKKSEGVQKVWILCITCMWSRAINLKICRDMTLKEFLRTLQLHILEQGMPEAIYSDLGSQLVAGANVISDWLHEPDTKRLCQENQIKTPKFTQYPKGNHKLGSLVEVCVKQCRALIDKSIRRNKLTITEFEVLIAQTINLVNKRPIAFREMIRNTGQESEIPEPITPEMLTRGYSTIPLNIIPHNDEDEWKPKKGGRLQNIRDEFSQLGKCRENLKKWYHEEFLRQLINQATNEEGRYKPKTHHKIKVNDIVLLKEENTKAVNYPLAIVKETIENELGETTQLVVKKGSTKEILKRDVEAVIPLVSVEEETK